MLHLPIRQEEDQLQTFNMELSINKFGELDECLSNEYSVDYWSDDVILYAGELIQNFSSVDWDNLEAIWISKTPDWQNYLAQTLAWGDSDKAVPLLLKLLSSDNEEIVISATDSLRDIQENIHPIIIAPELETHLRQVALQTKSALSAQTINIFLDKMKIK